MAVAAEDKTPSQAKAEFPYFLTQWTGFMLSWVSDLATLFYNDALAELGIDGRHLAIFETLKQLGPQVQAHLSTIVKVDKATMVSLLNDLEKRGLVERRPHPSDARAYLITITEQGQQFSQEALEVSRKASIQFFEALTPEEEYLFHDFLARIAKSRSSPDFFFKK